MYIKTDICTYMYENMYCIYVLYIARFLVVAKELPSLALQTFPTKSCRQSSEIGSTDTHTHAGIHSRIHTH